MLHTGRGAVERLRIAARRAARAAARSPGSGERSSSGSPVKGCSNARRAACRNWRSRPSRPGVPYSGSPATGCPIAWRCTRIWWVRPVSSRTRSSEYSGSARSSVEVRARLAREVAVDGLARAHARVAPDRRLDRAAARRRAALARARGTRVRCAARERALQQPVGLLGARDDEQTGGVAIQAVHDPRALRLPAGGDAGEQLRERALAVPASGVHDEAGGLVDDEQVLVFVDDREWRAWNHRSGGASAGGLRARAGARPQAGAAGPPA